MLLLTIIISCIYSTTVNKRRPSGLPLVARNSFYVEKLVLLAVWEIVSAGSVFLAGWLMSCAISYYLLFVFPGCRLLAVELTSSNTKPVVQEFQSECHGGPLAAWHDCCTALCLELCISPNSWEKLCLVLMVIWVSWARQNCWELEIQQRP